MGRVLGGPVVPLRDRSRGSGGGAPPLSEAELAALTEEAATSVRRARHPRRPVAGASGDPDTGAATLLARSEHTDLWLMAWCGTPFMELHDHGGSLGALTVVRGEIVEWHWDEGTSASAGTAEEALVGGAGPRRRLAAAGDTLIFGRDHVHDVSSRAPGALSVHAYSPPLRVLTCYRTLPGGLRPTRTEPVDPGPGTGVAA